MMGGWRGGTRQCGAGVVNVGSPTTPRPVFVMDHRTRSDSLNRHRVRAGGQNLMHLFRATQKCAAP